MARIIIALLLLASCSGLEEAHERKIRKANEIVSPIRRRHDEFHYRLPPPRMRVRRPYAWEENLVGGYPRITKEYFRCKGNALNPPILEEGKNPRHDCNGKETHSLSIIDGNEGVYPILLKLLNYIQETTKSKVVVTCGYRCPKHNTYADSARLNQTSKHTIGAEVDFYVVGYEEMPMQIIELIKAYYADEGSEYSTFKRYEGSDTNVSIYPWYNKEVFLKLYKEDEGRDLDNQHSYPYISIQVRHDRSANQRVTYSFDRAHKGFKRF